MKAAEYNFLVGVIPKEGYDNDNYIKACFPMTQLTYHLGLVPVLVFITVLNLLDRTEKGYRTTSFDTSSLGTHTWKFTK